MAALVSVPNFFLQNKGTRPEPAFALAPWYRGLCKGHAPEVPTGRFLRPEVLAGPAAPPSPPPVLWATAGLRGLAAFWLWSQPHPPAEVPSPSRELGPVLGSGPAQPDVPDGRVMRTEPRRGGQNKGQGAHHTPKRTGAEMHRAISGPRQPLGRQGLGGWAGAAVGQQPSGTRVGWLGVLSRHLYLVSSHPSPFLLAWQVPTVCVLRRSPEGAPVQVFVPENGEIMSQV